MIHNQNYDRFLRQQAADRFAARSRRKSMNFIGERAAALFLVVLSTSVFGFVAFALHVTFAAIAH
jgi:succinate dehydrogenase hydrophobic anchor subunit